MENDPYVVLANDATRHRFTLLRMPGKLVKKT